MIEIKVLMIYPDLETNVSYSFGTGILAAFLKKHGHGVRVVHLNEEIGYPLSYERVKKDVESFKPGLIAFSSTSNQFKFVKLVAKFIKKEFDIPILCGGVHATIAPLETISEDAIDFVCIGEGEYALLELVERLERNEDVSNIKNIWVKKGGEVIKNPLGPVVEDLDSLPFADRSVFDFDRILEIKRGWVNIMSGRGCPYRCSYCVNHFCFDLYRKGEIKYPVRQRSVENVLSEIKEIVKNRSAKMINFNDDTFTLNKEWVLEFCAEYAKKFKIPFACNVRTNKFDEEIAAALKAAGCEEVKIGLESGSERIRKEILNRPMSDEVIIKAFSTAKKAGLRCWSFNMIGIPTETREDVLKTIKLNAKIRPYILRCSILFPFKGTKIYEYCQRNGLIDEDKMERYSNYFEGSVLKMDSLSQVDILKFKNMFKWYVDAHSDIETSELFKALVEEFEQLPDEHWEDGKAKKMVKAKDARADNMLRASKKEHYCTRRQLDLNFCKELNFKLP